MKRIITAAVASLPLLPFILADRAVVKTSVEGRLGDAERFLLGPIVIELSCFAIIYGLIRWNGEYNRDLSRRGQWGLLVATVGLYIFFAIFFIAVGMSADALSQTTKISVLVLLVYSFFSLIITIKNISHNTGNIERYFTVRYMLPLSVAGVIYAIDSRLFSGLALAVNPIIVYLIVKNFTLARK